MLTLGFLRNAFQIYQHVSSNPELGLMVEELVYFFHTSIGLAQFKGLSDGTEMIGKRKSEVFEYLVRIVLEVT